VDARLPLGGDGMVPSPSPPPPPPAPALAPANDAVTARGLTNPFIRRAALTYTPSAHAPTRNPAVKLLHVAADLLRHPAYTIPLLLNLTGSVWFFLLIGKAELSLTVPIVNSLAFLFTVLGDYWADGKVVDRRTWGGIVAVCAGIALCVWGKS